MSFSGCEDDVSIGYSRSFACATTNSGFSTLANTSPGFKPTSQIIPWEFPSSPRRASATRGWGKKTPVPLRDRHVARVRVRLGHVCVRGDIGAVGQDRLGGEVLALAAPADGLEGRPGAASGRADGIHFEIVCPHPRVDCAHNILAVSKIIVIIEKSTVSLSRCLAGIPVDLSQGIAHDLLYERFKYQCEDGDRSPKCDQPMSPFRARAIITPTSNPMAHASLHQMSAGS